MMDTKGELYGEEEPEEGEEEEEEGVEDMGEYDDMDDIWLG